MRFDIEIKYKNGNKMCLDDIEKFEKKGNQIVFTFENNFVCMDRQEDISSLEITMIESEDYGRFCCR